ncbi:GNAT family N-acetyltransferase [Emticicia sp.]|uniref:GNAT family N-acetyltransferase n=1 Tax=Emticicia sp. TaxID=1930953 RepID=UPI0037504762
MNQYKCLEKQRFDLNEFSLIPIRSEDILKIRVWRNDQMKILRQNEYITEEKQIAYYENQIVPNFNSEHPKQLLFSYFKNNELIGYGGLVHFSWLDKRAEISFLLNTKFINDSKIHDLYFENYLHLIQKVAFEDLKLNRLHTEVYDTRQHHVDILENCGFILEGRLRNHIFIDERMVDSLLHGKLKSEYKF